MNNAAPTSICFLADAFISDEAATITGPMVQTYLIGQELKRRGWTVDFIAYNKQGKNFTETHEGLRVHWIRHRRLLPQIFYYLPLIKRLKAVNPDICYQRGRDVLTGFGVYYCRRHGKTMIWASAGESGVYPDKYAASVTRKNIFFLKKIILRAEAFINDRICNYGLNRAHHVIVQTEQQQKAFRSNFGRESVVIQSGHPVMPPVQRSMPLKILWIGSIKPVKRPEIFIEIAHAFSGYDCEFWIAGQMPDANYGNGILNSIRNEKNITYIGPVPFSKSRDWIARAHILVNTTRAGYEGLPNAFVQAWLAGTVTISLDADPDSLLSRQGLGACLHSKEAMIDYIANLIKHPDLWEALSAKSRRYAVENFSIEKITDQIINLLKQNHNP